MTPSSINVNINVNTSHNNGSSRVSVQLSDVNGILGKMEKFGQCDKLLDREGFCNEYRREISSANRREIGSASLPRKNGNRNTPLLVDANRNTPLLVDGYRNTPLLVID